MSDSVEMRVALWNRVSKNGNEYKYARLDLPQEQKKPEPVPEPEPVPDFNDDDMGKVLYGTPSKSTKV